MTSTHRTLTPLIATLPPLILRYRRIERVITPLRRFAHPLSIRRLRIHERRHPRQLLPLQELQRCAATRAHMREAARQPDLLDHRRRLAAADDRRRLA